MRDKLAVIWSTLVLIVLCIGGLAVFLYCGDATGAEYDRRLFQLQALTGGLVLIVIMGLIVWVVYG